MRFFARPYDLSAVYCVSGFHLPPVTLTLTLTYLVVCAVDRQMLCYGRRIPTEELQRRIMNTTRQDVIRTMHEYIYDREVALAGVGKHL